MALAKIMCRSSLILYIGNVPRGTFFLSVIFVILIYYPRKFISKLEVTSMDKKTIALAVISGLIVLAGCQKTRLQSSQQAKIKQNASASSIKTTKLETEVSILKKELANTQENISVLRERIIALEVSPTGKNPFTPPLLEKKVVQAVPNNNLRPMKRALKFLLWEHLAQLTLKTKQYVQIQNKIGFQAYAGYVRQTLRLLKTIDPKNRKRVAAEEAILTLQEKKLALNTRGYLKSTGRL